MPSADNASRCVSSRLSTAAAFAGLIVLTCGVYVFLNVATKGYYREALLLAAIITVVIVGVVVLTFA